MLEMLVAGKNKNSRMVSMHAQTTAKKIERMHRKTGHDPKAREYAARKKKIVQFFKKIAVNPKILIQAMDDIQNAIEKSRI